MANPASLTPNDLTQNGSIAQPAVQTVDTNGTINCATNKMDRLFLELVNLAANAITVTVKAGYKPTGTFGTRYRSGRRCNWRRF
jgi:hypothetical protein